MKKLYSTLIITLLLVASIGMATAAKAPEGPVMQIEEPIHDFGTFKEGEMKEHIFTFKNVGNTPLVVQHVEKPCGCTTAEWPKEPIMPGKSAEIKVVYNSKDRPGVFRKSMLVKTNMTGDQTIMLMIKGNAAKN